MFAIKKPRFVRPAPMMLWASGCILLCSLTSSVSGADPSEFRAAEPSTPASEYGLTIRSTPHRTPVEELAAFHVPEGFAVDLIASEPDIQKPLNMAFDSKGRLWVTQTSQYPFPAKEGEEPTDSIVVLEDKNNDGSFEHKKIFADKLNIPIGLVPYKDGVICFSIPNLLLLQDMDGDGVCDSRSILFGPFDTSRDTHGMVNALRDGGDGWIYGCHGFNNQSTVKGTDGHSITMVSGNVFRFRPDGSRIELYTQGQVNPFGMTRDEYGNWFTADCHSKPISQLVQGGCYPSFGRPDDGLGFVPSMMEHLHGSTAIAGLAHTRDSRFPASMSQQLLSGNVMTCRINRNKIEYRGTTAKAVELPDLLTSEDSWFRPVDLVFGPDGQLYIADFYNKIIGHYEVPLEHPDRDRTSGRIWRLRWNGPSDKPVLGKDLHSSSVPENDFRSDADLKDTAQAMAYKNAIERASLDASVDKLGQLLSACKKVYASNDPVLLQAYWISMRRAIRSASVARESDVLKLLQSNLESVQTLDEPMAQMLLRVLPSTREPQHVKLAIKLLQRRLGKQLATNKEEKARYEAAVEKISDVVDDWNIEAFIELLVSEAAQGNGDGQGTKLADRFLSIARRQIQSRGAVSPRLAEAAAQTLQSLAASWLDGESKSKSLSPLVGWIPSSSKNDERRTWTLEPRKAETHGQNPIQDSSPNQVSIEVYSSFPLGESYVGSWTTSPVQAPSEWTFAICGHNGLPTETDHQKNFARLLSIDLKTGETQELFRAYPPRSDVAKSVRWDLGAHANKTVLFEVVDGDAGPSYAWVGVGNFGVEGLRFSDRRQQLDRIQAYVNVFGVTAIDAESPMSKLLQSTSLDPATRFRLLQNTWAQSNPTEVEWMSLAMEMKQWDLLLSAPWPIHHQDRSEVMAWFAGLSENNLASFKRWPSTIQSRFVGRIAKNRGVATRLSEWIDSHVLPVDVLRVLPSSWWDSITETERTKLSVHKELIENRADRSKKVLDLAGRLRSVVVDLEVGKRVYSEKCAQCHKLGEIGTVVGPQLEGIGNRGLERLCEDILWPDRNVDEAFRVTLIRLEEGETITGLVQQRTAESLVIAEQTGKQRVIPIADIETEKRSEVSLMPGNFDEVLSPIELGSLIEYLKQKSVPVSK